MVNTATNCKTGDPFPYIPKLPSPPTPTPISPADTDLASPKQLATLVLETDGHPHYPDRLKPKADPDEDGKSSEESWQTVTTSSLLATPPTRTYHDDYGPESYVENRGQTLTTSPDNDNDVFYPNRTGGKHYVGAGQEYYNDMDQFALSMGLEASNTSPENYSQDRADLSPKISELSPRPKTYGQSEAEPFWEESPVEGEALKPPGLKSCLKKRAGQGGARNQAPFHDSCCAKAGRKVQFDPLALLLDAALEGELDMVIYSANKAPDPSASNDEGITALHNAICAGHYDIVKFLVEFGCDINAQDSDGWTPLHCAASCNNIDMIQFLVENGASVFATTVSDHETPLEKCEEDEIDYDHCASYLYKIQEGTGIGNGAKVHALYDFEAKESDELSFVLDEALTITDRHVDENWWLAVNSLAKSGFIPKNYIGLYKRVTISRNLSND